MSQKIKPEIYCALSHCVSHDDTRFYLLGIYLCPSESGGTIAVSTDGNMLAAYHMADVPCDEPVLVKVSKDMVRAARALIKANARAHPVDHGKMALDGDVLTIGGQSFTDAVIDGTFPDWQRLVPRPDQLKQDTVCITPALLNTFGVIAKELGCNIKSATLFPSGERGPMLIGLHDANFMGLLMPNNQPSNAPKIVRQVPRLEVVA